MIAEIEPWLYVPKDDVFYPFHSLHEEKLFAEETVKELRENDYRAEVVKRKAGYLVYAYKKA